MLLHTMLLHQVLLLQQQKQHLAGASAAHVTLSLPLLPSLRLTQCWTHSALHQAGLCAR
jgi:hypothetical protein